MEEENEFDIIDVYGEYLEEDDDDDDNFDNGYNNGYNNGSLEIEWMF